MLGGCSSRFGDLGRELAYRGERMTRVGAPPPGHLLDDVDGFLAVPEGRLAGVL